MVKKKYMALLAAGLLSGLMGSSARADHVELTGVLHSGAETVTLTGTAVPGTTQGGVYSDVLTFQELSGIVGGTYHAETATAPLTPGLIFETYCIDIKHDIGVGGTYMQNPVSLATAAAATGPNHDADLSTNSNIATAIAYLFGSNIYGTMAANGEGGLVAVPPGGTNSSIITAAQAANFQAALWAIIYDNLLLTSASSITDSAHLTGLSITGLGSVGTGLDAFSLATRAWNDAVAFNTHIGTVHSGDVQDTSLEALTNTNAGQEQTFITTANAPGIAPLPGPGVAGLVLFGIMGLGALAKRSKAISLA